MRLNTAPNSLWVFWFQRRRRSGLHFQNPRQICPKAVLLPEYRHVKITGLAENKYDYSGNIQPAYSRMDWFLARLSDWTICLRYSLGDICITLVKYLL